MVFRTLSILMGCFLLLANCATMSPGMKAYQARDYEAALPLLTEEANQGNMDSAFALGQLYSRGVGTKKNLQKGFTWYKAAADQGHLRAQLKMGEAYLKGPLRFCGSERASYYYRLAAEQGNKMAQFELGLLYLKGRGGADEDHLKAVEWLEKSAKHISAKRIFYYVPPIKEGGSGHMDSIVSESAKPGHEGAKYYLYSIYRGAYGDAPDPEKASKYEKSKNWRGRKALHKDLLDLENPVHQMITNDDSSTISENTYETPAFPNCP